MSYHESCLCILNSLTKNERTVHKMLCVGVDAHRATCHITVMDETGKVLERKRVPSTPAGVGEALGSFHEPMKAVLEASYNWGPVSRSIRIPWRTCCAPM